MSKRESSKYKIDRRMGENIWGRPKSPVNRREYGPGQHGQRRKSKLSDFGVQLRAKQKLKGYYGDIREKQFRAIFAEASRRKGDTRRTWSACSNRASTRSFTAPSSFRRFLLRASSSTMATSRSTAFASTSVPTAASRATSSKSRKSPSSSLRFWKPYSSPSATFLITSKPITTRWSRPSFAFPLSPTCRTRSSWSRTWSSNSIRVNRASPERIWKTARRRAVFLYEVAGRIP